MKAFDCGAEVSGSKLARNKNVTVWKTISVHPTVNEY